MVMAFGGFDIQFITYTQSKQKSLILFVWLCVCVCAHNTKLNLKIHIICVGIVERFSKPITRSVFSCASVLVAAMCLKTTFILPISWKFKRRFLGDNMRVFVSISPYSMSDG